jgi:hypothetical protein
MFTRRTFAGRLEFWPSLRELAGSSNLVTKDQETLVENLLLKKLTSTEISKQTGIPRHDIRLFRRSFDQAIWVEREKKNIEKHESLLLDRDYRSYLNESAFAARLECKRN